MLVYGFAWLPMNGYNLLHMMGLTEFSQIRYLHCHLIGMTSALLNPIMYGLINDSFRTAFLNMLRPFFGPCTKYIAVSPNQPTHTTYSFTTMNAVSPNSPLPHPPPVRRRVEPPHTSTNFPL